MPKGRWIRGGQWHPVAQLAEKRFLIREELDRAAPNNPVCLPIGHFTLVNSEALALAGITRDTPDPDGGIIHRDKTTGECNGTLEEAAEDLVHNLLPDWSDDERDDQMKHAMQYFNEFGLTSAISLRSIPQPCGPINVCVSAGMRPCASAPCTRRPAVSTRA